MWVRIESELCMALRAHQNKIGYRVFSLNLFNRNRLDIGNVISALYICV